MVENFNYAATNDTASETASDSNHHHDQHLPPFPTDSFSHFLPQHEDADIGLRDDEELGLRENRLPSTNLEPVIERMNDLAKTQAEMMRVQREIMGAMFSLSMRMDAAIADRSANTRSMKDIKGKGRQIDFKGEDGFSEDSGMVFESSESNAHFFEIVNFLSERIGEVGKDVGLLLGHVLGTSHDAEVVSINAQNSRKRRRVDSTTAEACGSGSSTSSGNVTEPGQQSILNRLGSIESAVYELLEKLKDQEYGNNDGLRQEDGQENIPGGPQQVIAEDPARLVAQIPPPVDGNAVAPAADPVVERPVPEAPVPALGAQGLNNALGANLDVAQPVNRVAGLQGTVGVVQPDANIPPQLGAAPGSQNLNLNANVPPPVPPPQVPPPAYTPRELIPDPVTQPEAHAAYLRNRCSRLGLPPTPYWLTLADNLIAAMPNMDPLPNLGMIPPMQRQRASGARPTTAYERFLQTLGDHTNNLNAANGTNAGAAVARPPGLQMPVGGGQPANQLRAIQATHQHPMRRMVSPYQRMSGASYLPPHIGGGAMQAQAGPSNLNLLPNALHAPHQHSRFCMPSRSLWEDDDDIDMPDLLPPRGPWGF